MTGALTPVPNNNPASQGQESGPSTGVKMFLILTLALLPLGLIALFASLLASHTADLEKAALLHEITQTSWSSDVCSSDLFGPFINRRSMKTFPPKCWICSIS